VRKKIFVGFVVLATCFIAGGVYITISIDRVISKLETMITLHQVEILRKNLLNDIKAVQQDLLLKDSPHAAQIDSIVLRGEKMTEQVENCFSCHHEEPVLGQLAGLREEIEIYQQALSRVYTARADIERLNWQTQMAFHYGQQLIRKIDQLTALSSDTLSGRTEAAMLSISYTKRLLTLLVVLGPVIGLAIALYFVRDLTSSVATLINATRKIKAGQLDHKIEGLSDEFGEVCGSVNEMALALKEMIRAAEESEKRYRMLFESAGDAIFVLEAKGANLGRIVSANEAAAGMHCYSPDELLRLNIGDLDSRETAAGGLEGLDRILAGEWVSCETTHRRKDGSDFPVEVSAGLLELEDQKYILMFNKDITERKQAEEALQRAEQLVVVGEMAAGLAHEIKNPLAGIKLSIEVLTTDLELTQEDKEVFSRVVGEINRIETLVKNLLNYAMPPTPQFMPIDVNKIVESAIKTASFSLKGPTQKAESKSKKDVRFIRDLSETLPQIVADASQLQQVMLNLLLNAIYAVQDSGSILVKTAEDARGLVRIVISDTGKGIGESEMDKIFLPFFTTKAKGTGLGLPICKRLIEQHNGTIRATRNSDGGLAFTIELPADQDRGGILR
jgi:two-component system sensor histidine kinase AtoS